MRYGYIICALAHDAAHVVLASNDPPAFIETTDWSQFPAIKRPRLLIEGTGTYFLLRVPGSAKGLYRALEEMMDVAGVHRDGYVGLENHRALLTAVGKVRIGATDRVLVDFTLSPERLRLQEMERFEAEHADWWSGHCRCLSDPGCAEVFRRGR
jgi:hypothetical protein